MNITDKVREDVKPVWSKSIGVSKEMLSTSADPLLSAALRALNTLALTVSPGEEHSLTTTVPLVIDNIRERKSTRSALEVLLALSYVYPLSPSHAHTEIFADRNSVPGSFLSSRIL